MARFPAKCSGAISEALSSGLQSGEDFIFYLDSLDRSKDCTAFGAFQGLANKEPLSITCPEALTFETLSSRPLPRRMT
jgi:hypothetical protein